MDTELSPATLFSLDGKVAFVTGSFAGSLRSAIHTHAFDPDTGEPGKRRVFARTEPPGFPDGSAVDAEGVTRPTCCAFGGPGPRRCSSPPSRNMSEAERAAQPLAGALLALDVGIRSLPEPRFPVSRVNAR